MKLDHDAARQLLQQALGNPRAEFRDGQWEAISAIVNQRSRALIVQRTGWGKSIVYFLATKILRDRTAGPTLIISPLLALMRNQLAAAKRLGLVAATINSDNQADWEAIQTAVTSDQIDALLVSPERLANEDFLRQTLLPIAGRIGLFVIDEAHCISDWGHDFRPDYQRIGRILQILPPNLPVLATTATANNRVVQDVAHQLGDPLTIQRGPLTRTSLQLQTLMFQDPADRLAWLAEVLPTLPSSGIIYTLTIRDADQVSKWLQSQGINALSYSSKSEARNLLEQALLSNEIKALISTSALGMGFDKPDLGFVIHYQRPSSIVHYYQQVGRAGRAMDCAYGILVSGPDDDEITDYFIQSAFPPQNHTEKILAALEQSEDGLSIPQLEIQLNLSKSHIEKAIKIMAIASPAPITKLGANWQRTASNYELDQEKIATLTQLRRQEQAEMRRYSAGDRCLMRILAEALDDPAAQDCGRCSVCQGRPIVLTQPTPVSQAQAITFLQRTQWLIEPRKKWPTGGLSQYGYASNTKIPQPLQAQTGLALCRWGDAGWGRLVKQGKYQVECFDDQLVSALAEAIAQSQFKPSPTWVTCVPSLTRPQLVPHFARRLAAALGLPLIDCIKKIRPNQPQKEMQNSYQQATNLDGCFKIEAECLEGPVFLVDDMVDSRWTFTVLAALLQEQGSGPVFPLALALSTNSDIA